MATETSGPLAVRSINVHPSTQWDADAVEQRRSALREWVARADAANLNVLYAWLESPFLAALLGEDRYREQYPFWDTREWDPLGELLEAAAAHGIEVHAWYSFTRYKRDREWVPEYDPDLSVLPPGDPDWASVTRSEYEDGRVDPADPAVDGSSLCTNAVDAHEWTLEALGRLLEAYPDLGGLRIEEPGYLDLERCVCDRCRAVYEQLTGDPGDELLEHVHDEVAAYREDDVAVRVKTHGTDDFVRRLHGWWASVGDGRPLTFNGGWDPAWDRARGRNWTEWSEWGAVPYFSPQVYTEDVDEMADQLRTTMDGVGGDTAVVPSVGISWSRGSNEPETVVEQVEAAAAADGYGGRSIAGVNLFAGASLTSELAELLAAGPYGTDAAPPWRR